MKKLAFLLLVVPPLASAQAVVEWSPVYKIQKSDFGAKAPNRGSGQAYYASCNLDFSFQMNTTVFLFTKNFNRFVTASFNREASWLDEGDQTEIILRSAQLQFDLAELYARRFRKRLFEEKKTFSSVDFANEAFQEIQKQYAQQLSDIYRDTKGGAANGRVTEIHNTILKELETLAPYCKECTPTKRKANQEK